MFLLFPWSFCCMYIYIYIHFRHISIYSYVHVVSYMCSMCHGDAPEMVGKLRLPLDITAPKTNIEPENHQALGGSGLPYLGSLFVGGMVTCFAPNACGWNVGTFLIAPQWPAESCFTSSNQQRARKILNRRIVLQLLGIPNTTARDSFAMYHLAVDRIPCSTIFSFHDCEDSIRFSSWGW